MGSSPQNPDRLRLVARVVVSAIGGFVVLAIYLFNYYATKPGPDDGVPLVAAVSVIIPFFFSLPVLVLICAIVWRLARYVVRHPLLATIVAGGSMYLYAVLIGEWIGSADAATYIAAIVIPAGAAIFLGWTYLSRMRSRSGREVKS